MRIKVDIEIAPPDEQPVRVRGAIEIEDRAEAEDGVAAFLDAVDEGRLLDEVNAAAPGWGTSPISVALDVLRRWARG